MYRELVLVTGLTLAGTLLAPAQAQQDQETREIQLRDFAIEPATFSATAGQTIRLGVANTGGAQHNLAFAPESGEPVQILFPSNLRPGQSDTAEFTFSQSGTWTMYCPVGSHRARGMQGSVQVQEAGDAADNPMPADSSTSDAPPADTPVPTVAPPPPATNTPVPPPAPNPPPRRTGY